MVATGKLKGILNTLPLDGVLHVPFDGLDISLKGSADRAAVCISAVVFCGEQYIPKSIRKCIQGRGPCAGFIPESFVHVDEVNCRVDLNSNCLLKGLSEDEFIELLEEFSFQVEEWKHFINRHGEGDLVYIHAKPL